MGKHTANQKKTKVQKVLIFFIAFFLVILAGLAAIVIRDFFSSETEIDDEPDPNVIEQPETPDLPERAPERTPDPLANTDGVNPLTGEPMDSRFDRNRPLAVVLNNLPEALPLNGVSSADIIYEYPVEGGLTRMLALFQDVFYVEKIGSIRSARHYTVQLAHSYDAILVAAGRSPQALAEVRSLGIPFLNEVEGPHREIFFRDRNRIPGQRVQNLHSVITTGYRIHEMWPQYDFRIDHERNYAHVLRFVDDGTPQRGSDADKISMRFSSAKSTTFTYDSALNGYTVLQSNKDFVDANDNSRPVFANVLFLKTSVTGLRDDTAGRLDIVTTGRGEGYFASGGKYVKINWIRPDKESQFSYTHEDGTLLDFGVGKTYICILPTNIDPTFG